VRAGLGALLLRARLPVRACFFLKQPPRESRGAEGRSSGQRPSGGECFVALLLTVDVPATLLSKLGGGVHACSRGHTCIYRCALIPISAYAIYVVTQLRDARAGAARIGGVDLRASPSLRGTGAVC
jgi:hypothetical protein